MNESITITPAENGYVASKFNSEAPDNVFRSFDALVEHLLQELPYFGYAWDDIGSKPPPRPGWKLNVGAPQCEGAEKPDDIDVCDICRCKCHYPCYSNGKPKHTLD